MQSLGVRVVGLYDQILPWAHPYVVDWITPSKKESMEQILLRISEYMEHGHTIDGVITFCEEEVPLVATICEKFGFIGNSLQTAMNTRSKFLMQELFRKDGEHATNQYLLKSKEDLNPAIEKVGFPAVMKPVFGSDSQAVVFVNNREEAEKMYKHVTESFTFPDEGHFKYKKGDFVFQEYIPGIEFSLECYIQNGEPHVAGIHEKMPMEMPYFVETGEFVPPRISSEERETLENEAKAALVALGVQNSLAHVEMKLMPDGTAHIIEIASRMGGEYLHRTLKMAYGFDMVKAGLQIALGIPVTEVSTQIPESICAKVIIPKMHGVVKEMKGFDILKTHPNILEYGVSVKLGQHIRPPKRGLETVGYIIVKGENAVESERMMNEIMDSLEIVVE